MTTCGELLATMLDSYGIDTAFGIPGVHTIELYRGLPQTNIRHITPRHEQGAGFMADGYARVTGKPAVCFTISGPGALNISTAMGQALQDSVPMLVISADNDIHTSGMGEGRLHETRALGNVMAECSVWAHRLMRPDELPKVLARAFSILRSERPGPVHITLPLDVITADASHVSSEIWNILDRPAPNPTAIKKAAALINGAKNPVIALGGGACDAADGLRKLIELMDAPTTLTHNAKGILPCDHPLYIKGNPMNGDIQNMYRDADVILGIGTEFGETDYSFPTDGKLDLGDAKLIRVDISAAQLTRNVKPELAICADSALTIDALLPLLTSKKADGSARVNALNSLIKQNDNEDYQVFLDAIQEALPECVFIGDSTQPVYWASGQYHPSAPRSLACSSTGYGTLGYALPAAIGAKLAKPEAQVVCVVGDGGFQYTINELSSAIEANTPIAILVWNNECYDMIAQGFIEAGMKPVACDIHTPDFLKIAEGYGCLTASPATIDDLKSALKASQTASVPTVIQVMESDFVKPK